MNSAQVRGRLAQLRGRAKFAWGGLTHDNVRKLEGTAERIYGVVQAKIGDTKELIKTKLAWFQSHQAKRP